jgi:hypothetical protein
VLGQGTQNVATLGSLGSATTVLHGGPGAPAFGVVVLGDMETRTLRTLMGRGDSGNGVPQEITLGSGLTMSGTTLSAPTAGGGTVNPATLAGQLAYYQTATAAVFGHPAITSTTAGNITINQSGAAAPALSIGPLQLVGATNTGPQVELYSFGTATTPGYSGWAAAGTPGSPLAATSGLSLVGLTGFGYTGAGYSGQRGQVLIRASEAWSGAVREPRSISTPHRPGSPRLACVRRSTPGC